MQVSDPGAEADGQPLLATWNPMRASLIARAEERAQGGVVMRRRAYHSGTATREKFPMRARTARLGARGFGCAVLSFFFFLKLFFFDKQFFFFETLDAPS